MTTTPLIDKPDCAAPTVGDLNRLWEAISRALKAAAPDAGEYVTELALCQHFHCSRTRIATAIHRAKLQPTQIGRARKYPRAIAIAALAPHLS